MTRLAIPVITLMLILGMSSMATAQLTDGTYDFYGTLYVEQYEADGNNPPGCALETNGLTCPTALKICIKNLDVSGGGTQITSGDGAPYYGIAVEKVPGTVMALDIDGAGPVDLTVGPGSNDDRQCVMVVGDDGGGSCAASTAAACVTSWSFDEVGGPGGTGTVIGSVPAEAVGSIIPLTYPQCGGGLASYTDPTYTTENVTASVSNENGTNQTVTDTGSRLSGNSLTLKTLLVRYRFGIGPVVLGSDIMGVNTIEGQFCQPAGSCADANWDCPAEDD